MPASIGRIGLLSCAAVTAALWLCCGRAEEARTYSIPAQALGPALREFARQSNREILFSSEVVQNKTTAGVSGAPSADAALTGLLTGTGLVSALSPSGQILISNADAREASAPARPRGAPEGAQNELAAPSPTNTPRPPGSIHLEEVVVTAQKREERLQDVPVPVTVINAETLVEQNQVRLQDYYATIPGLTFTPQDIGGADLTIRGVTTGPGNPTVAVMIDDVPFGTSTGLGFAQFLPDLDPSELQRVEVLRGPQGTIYGASSLGGVVKYVTVDPSTAAMSARLEGDVSAVHHGDQAGYGLRGSVNVPLTDTLAIRLSGFGRRDPGYIDNVATGMNGVNWGTAAGGRLSALWRPVSQLAVNFSALVQNTTVHGYPEVTVGPGLGDLQQDFLRGTGGYHSNVQAYSLSLKANLGVSELSFLSGYNVNTASDSYDFTSLVGECCTRPQFGVASTALVSATKTRKLTEELRISTPIGQRVKWLVGFFYTHEASPSLQQDRAIDATTGEPIGLEGQFDWTATYAEYALFTDLTFTLADRLTLQVGGRESYNRQTYSEIDSGPIVPGIAIQPSVGTHDNSATYLLTPSYRISDDLMVYARLASGYRAGGPNSTCSLLGVPCEYAPDKTLNYELGFKGALGERALTFDASLFYIDWKNIQLILTDPDNGFNYSANGSRAKSEGLELSVESRPLGGLTVGGWLSLSDAQLTRPFPPPPASPVYGAPGNPLPWSSRFSGSGSFQYEFPMTDSLQGSVGGAVSYVGNRTGLFTGSAARQDYPAYTRTDLHLGVRFDGWTANVFANNVTDRRGLLTGGLGTVNPAAFSYIQPRTVGLTVVRAF